MPVDYETLRRNRLARPELTPYERHELSQAEVVWLTARREEVRQEQEEARHRSELLQFEQFASRKAATARKAERADEAETWDVAATNIRDSGVWTSARIIRSDPEIVAFQDLRTRCAYAGDMVNFDA